MDIANMEYIGSGAQADIYLYEGKAVKVYKLGGDVSEGLREAKLQEMAYDKGLPVPKVFETAEIDGRTAIVMEYVRGDVVGEIMLESMEKAQEYLMLSVDLQMKIHQTSGDGFPSQKEKLEQDLYDENYLSTMQRVKLLRILEELPDGDRLCHGDYHVLNLLQTVQDIKIIDWVCASSGNIIADVCRSYLLYLLYSEQIADVYLDIYCKTANISREDVIDWLPVIAGARLNENLEDGHLSKLLRLADCR